MQKLNFKGRTYEIDEEEFLVDTERWDENFAEGMAPRTGIQGGLTNKHWDVIKFIRKSYLETGSSPMVYKTCKALKLRLADLEKLFPAGYRRGACKLAGFSYMPEDILLTCSKLGPQPSAAPGAEKVYRVNAAGFLVDPAEWDEEFASGKMREMKVPGPFADRHCQIIYYLRDYYAQNGKVPTVYETCAANKIEIDELEKLFPDGYHRGAVKIAGLR